MSRASLTSLAALVACSVFTESAGAAPTKLACVEAHGDGQAQRKAGKVLAARDRFLVCADEACPAVVRKECLAWAQEVDGEAASFVVDASLDDAQTSAVVVSIDGRIVARQLDGRPITADPGPHALRFETTGAPAIEQQVTLLTGEKHRRLPVAFRRQPATPSPATTPSAAPDAPLVAVSPAPSRSALPLVFGGVGAVGVAGFAYFGLAASRKKSDLDDRGCKPACPRGDVDAVKRDYLFANVSLGVGVLGLGVATYLLVGRASKPERAALVVAPTRDGAVGGVVGAF
ncbi:MAG: hypothetical protein IT374_11045 [Polyangiaceae bacterium]|nr:hypothetical protein [Polyangiaceae bacterium]